MRCLRLSLSGPRDSEEGSGVIIRSTRILSFLVDHESQPFLNGTRPNVSSGRTVLIEIDKCVCYSCIYCPFSSLANLWPRSWWVLLQPAFPLCPFKVRLHNTPYVTLCRPRSICNSKRSASSSDSPGLRWIVCTYISSPQTNRLHKPSSKLGGVKSR